MTMRAPSSDAHWRDSARPARFFVVDAQAAFPLLFFLLHIEWWTFVLAGLAMSFFTALNRFGFSVAVFGRLFRSFLAGKRKGATPWWL